MPTVQGVPSDLLNLSQTAEVLGVHRNTLTTWIKRGVFDVQPAIGGEGSRPRYRRSDIEAIVHGEPPAQAVLKAKIEAELGWNVTIPHQGQIAEL